MFVYFWGWQTQNASCEVMTWAEVGHSTDWATQVPLAYYFWDSSVLWCISVLNSFLSLNSIWWYGCTTFFTFSCSPGMDIWIVFIFWLLWIMLLWTFAHKSLCGHRFHFSWVDELNCCLCLPFLRTCQTAFQSGRTILYSYQQYMRVPAFSHPHPYLCFWLYPSY